MKKNEIRVGGLYLAKVSGNLTTVRVDAICDVEEVRGWRNSTGRLRKAVNRYDVTNLKTGRKTTFRSAAKFRSEVNPNGGLVSQKGRPKPKPDTTQFGSPQTGFPEDGGTVGGPTFLPILS